MANGVWHAGYGIEVNLSLFGLVQPDCPDLLQEVTASVSGRDPQMLECLAHHEKRECLSEWGGKSPWMFIRRGRVGGRRPLVASHLPITHKATPAESAQHRATKERIVETAGRYGLDAEAEVPVANRRSVSDAVVTGPGGLRIGWEIQYHHLGPSSVHRRSVNAVEDGITPLWVAKDRTASLIGRAPWARVDDMPWKNIIDGKEMVIRGGYRHLGCVSYVDLDTSRSTYETHPRSLEVRSEQRAPLPRQRRRRPLWRDSRDWFVPALCLPQRKPVHIEDLVLQSATGESVPVYVPNRGNGRAGRHMWVSVDDRALGQELIGEKTPLPTAPAEDEDDVITFAEKEIDRTCRAGEEGWFVSDGRPIRDLDQPTGGFTLPRMSVQRSRDPMRITTVERAAASAALGCPP
ncbi:competence protein CoiA family protein [Streptomyces ipomoeae]|nr:hypothetical protein [Streptomyces ipomoeae]MDX2698387.1 hypothetical protein [Streptomyces ipomoeae]MDX2698388.1 hypothetical protein [Streptomyces ipomoeae]